MTSALGGEPQTPTKIEGGREAIGAAITGGILGQAAKGGFVVNEDAAAAMQEQHEQDAPETPQEAVSAPPDPVDEIVDSLTTELAEKVEEAPIMEEADEDFDMENLPDFEAEVDKELLDEEISASGEEGYVDESQEWIQDPADRDAERRARIAEKKARHFEQLTAQRERAKWIAEADKHYPMWRARGDITATSKRGFLKAAKESHDAVKPFVKAAVKTREEQLEAERAQLKQQVKQEANEAWGKPTAGVQTPVTQTEYDEATKEYAKARKDNDLAMMLHWKRQITALGGGEIDG